MLEKDGNTGREMNGLWGESSMTEKFLSWDCLLPNLRRRCIQSRASEDDYNSVAGSKWSRPESTNDALASRLGCGCVEVKLKVSIGYIFRAKSPPKAPAARWLGVAWV